jgi:hypothetical protein
MHSNVMVGALGNKLDLGSSHREMGIRHQRYKGVPVDISKTSRLHHKRIAFVLFFYSQFNKFTDRMLEITGIKSFSETDRQW